MDVVLWGVLPYLVLAVLVLGTMWRYRYDKFGWTTRSSQLYESRLLRIGSPLFHFHPLPSGSPWQSRQDGVAPNRRA